MQMDLDPTCIEAANSSDINRRTNRWPVTRTYSARAVPSPKLSWHAAQATGTWPLI
jgi:hypothetical protein